MTAPSPAEAVLYSALGLAALALGGALGAPLRLVLERHLSRRGILVANTLAALVLGLSMGLPTANLLVERHLLGGAMLLGAALVSGFCLALGTWSTVAGWTADAVLASRWGEAVRTWAAHLGLGLAAVIGGWGAGHALSAALG